LKAVVDRRWCHLLLLLLWVAIGASLRVSQLAAKPPWTDEFATLVFSLGQSFATVPLDQPISLDALLQPLHLNPQADWLTVARQLLSEDVHPPVYFVLAHQWLRWLLPQDQIASIWITRSLPVLLGVAAIPAVFGLGWLAFRSLVVSQLAAALMAVSPFGVFLAQEARHYTLAILWVITSLCCFVVAVQRLDRRLPLSGWLVIAWISVNALGIATHYFFLLTLAAMAMVLLSLGLIQARKDWRVLLQPQWQQIYAVALGMMIICLLWLPVWHGLRSQEATQWIQSSDDRLNLPSLFNPVFQALAAWITMLALLPVEADALPLVLIAGLAMIVFFLWVIPLLLRGLQRQPAPASRLSVQVLGKFVLGSIALFFLITYGLGSDLTRGARYNFVYFPAVIVLASAGLAVYWHSADPLRGKRAVAAVWVVGLLSALTVVSNLGYQKYYRPDLLVPLMQNGAHDSVLIATTHRSLVQIGEMMGLAWEFRSHPDANLPLSHIQFLLAQQPAGSCAATCEATVTLQKTLAQLPQSIDLWLVNFHADANLAASGCVLDRQPTRFVSGYSYQRYHCQPQA
jgi:uncharacterized membrane protein